MKKYLITKIRQDVTTFPPLAIEAFKEMIRAAAIDEDAVSVEIEEVDEDVRVLKLLHSVRQEFQVNDDASHEENTHEHQEKPEI